MLLVSQSETAFEVGLIEESLGGHRLVRRHEGGHRRRRRQPVRSFPREEPGEEVRPVAGHLEQRFVEQLLMQIAATDVEDDRQRRLEGQDVRVILLGPDAEVDAARLRGRDEGGDDDLIPALVREEVVRLKLPVRLGDHLGQVPELLVRQRRWNRGRLGDEPGRGDQSRPADEGDENASGGSCHEWKVLTMRGGGR